MRNLIIILMNILLLSACNSNHKTGNLELNNGEKWKVNVEMKPHIEQGNKIMNNYLLQKRTDYQELANDLKSQNKKLIKSCTMKGEGHDELHKWLHPHIELIKKLSNTKNLEEAESVVSQIEQSFTIYQKYFD